MPGVMRRRGAALCALAAALLCLVDVGAAAAARKQDKTQPVVGFDAPTAGATVSTSLSGTTCEATATDNVGVARVEFSVDGKSMSTDRSAPYNCAWDATGAAAGQHTLTARAVDTSGNAATSSISVSVADSSPAPAPSPSPTPTAAPSLSPPLPAGWTLSFEDDFDGPAAPPDSTKWNLYNSAGHAGNGLRRPSQCALDGNGLLVLTAEAKIDPADGVLKTWSCGMSSKWSSGIGNTIYGRFESLVRTEPDPSGTMSGLTLGWPDAGNSQLNGELDFYETGHATSRNPFYSYLHWPNCSSTCQTRIGQYADASEWHVMTMDWTPTRIDIYRDGVLIGAETDPSHIPSASFHPTIQLDAFNTTPLPAPVHEYVDWIRVYKP